MKTVVLGILNYNCTIVEYNLYPHHGDGKLMVAAMIFEFCFIFFFYVKLYAKT